MIFHIYLYLLVQVLQCRNNTHNRNYSLDENGIKKQYIIFYHFIQLPIFSIDAVKGSVFVKSVPEDEVHNRRMSTVTHFRNEILAYERILTVLGTFTSGSLRLPAYIYGNRANIVLEDMVNRSFTSMNRRFINTWEKVWSPIQVSLKLRKNLKI